MLLVVFMTSPHVASCVDDVPDVASCVYDVTTCCRLLLGGQNRAQIQAAVNDWNRYTCIRFRPHQSGDRNYIRIQNGGG